MTEKKKGVRELERELAEARAEQYAHHSRSVTKNRDFSVGGVDPNAVKKERPDSAGVADAILLPKKKRSRTPNNPWG